MTSRAAKQVVCIVGAGTAGLEALLCARARLGPDAELRLIAPEREFRYRPMTPESLFRPARERALAIADVVRETGASWIQDRADAIHEEDRAVLTRDGDTVGFDYLLLTLGAQTSAPLQQGQVWERGRDPSSLDRIIDDILSGAVQRVAVNIPRGARWPLPGYELALVLGWRAMGTDARVTLLTAEERPLAELGSAATDAVGAELAAAGIEVVAGVDARDADAGLDRDSGSVGLTLSDVSDRRPIRATAFDRLLSLPTVVAPFLAGVPTDAAGFIETDETLRVCGSERVWAAGSCIAAALEHSGLAAQQADVAISAIASVASIADAPAAAAGSPDLTGMLLTGQRARWLVENPPGVRQPSTRCLWWPPGRAVGRMLAQRIEAWDPEVHQQLPSVSSGVAIRAPIALGCSGTSSLEKAAEIGSDVRAARLRDIENRQLMAVERRERAADASLRELSAGLESLAAHQQEVIRELQRHGYLQHRG